MNQLQTQDEKSLPTGQLIPKYARLKLNSQRQDINNPLIDVIFTNDGPSSSANCANSKFQIGAHRFILLDGPVVRNYFHEKLSVRNVHVPIIIYVPPDTVLETLDALLNYIYGMQLESLEISERNLNGFLVAATHFGMDIELLPKLLEIFNAEFFEDYIRREFHRLFTCDGFWELENRCILKLCQFMSPDDVEDAFFDWIYANKAQRKIYLDKLMNLRIRHQGELKIENENHDQENTENGHGNSSTDSNSTIPITTETNAIAQKRKRNDSLSESEEVQQPEKCSRKSSPRANGHPKQMLSGLDYFFKDLLESIENILAEPSPYTKDFHDLWSTVREYTSEKHKKSRRLNCQRFIQENGIELLFKSSHKFQNEELKRTLLAIISNCAEVGKIRPWIFSKQLIEYVMNESSSTDFWLSSTGAEILSYFLHTYGHSPTGNEWTIKTSREDVSAKVLQTVTRLEDISVDREICYTSLKEFQPLVQLIQGNDPTARMCGLWSLYYFTAVVSGSNSEERNEEALKHRDFLRQANCKTLLEEIAFQRKTGNKQSLSSNYAQKILANVWNVK